MNSSLRKNILAYLSSKHLWYSFSGVVCLCIVGIGLHAYFDNQTTRHVDTNRIENEGVPSTPSFKTLPEVVQSEPILLNQAVQRLEKTHRHSLEELVSAADLLIQEGWEFTNILRSLDSVRNTDDRSLLQMLILQQLLAARGAEHVVSELTKNLVGELKEKMLVELTRLVSNASPRQAISIANQATNRPEFLEQLHETVIDTWAKTNPQELYDNLSLFPDGWPQRYALMQGSLGIARESPTRAQSLLKRFEGSVLEQMLIEEIARGKVRQDPIDAISWASDSKQIPTDVRTVALSAVLVGMTATHPDLAYETALGVGPSLAHRVLEQIAREDLALATRLVTSAENDSNNAMSYQIIGKSMIQQRQYETLFALGSDVPALLQNGFYESALSEWSRLDPLSLMSAYPSLPQKIKKIAATYLLVSHSRIPVLDEEEVDSFRALVLQESGSSSKLFELLGEPVRRISIDYDALGNLSLIKGMELQSMLLREERLKRD